MVAKLKISASKLFQMIVVIVVIFISGLSQKYVRRFFHMPQRFDTLENSDSELLGILITESKFSNVWKWDGVITNQFDHVNYDSNIDELATRMFVGYRKGHEVRFIHTVTRYVDSPGEPGLDPMWKGIGVDAILEEVSIPLPEDSTFLSSACYVGLKKPETKVVRCVLVRSHENIHERIDLDTYGEMNVETLSQFVNNIAMVFDDKVVKVE